MIGVVAVGVAAVGCNDTSTDTTASSAPLTVPVDSAPATSEGVAAVCTEIELIQDFDAETAAATDQLFELVEADEAALIAGFNDVADTLDGLLPQVLATYERAAELAPPDVGDDLLAVGEGTALLTPAIVEVLRVAQSIGDLAALEDIFSDQELADAAISAGEASLRLDDFTIPNCGFPFATS